MKTIERTKKNKEEDYRDVVPVSVQALKKWKQFNQFCRQNDILIYRSYNKPDGSLVVKLKKDNVTQHWDFFADGQVGLTVVEETESFSIVDSDQHWDQLTKDFKSTKVSNYEGEY
jgi:hypothetical protein